MTIKLMFITNRPEVAKIAQLAGVDRIFIDLEKIGKFERQGHLDTVISSHSIEDVSLVKETIDKSELLVRINPIHVNTDKEIEEVINNGADILMLPMFKTPREVESFINYVNGRAKTCLLLETSEALARLDQILDIDGIDEIHIGLNDLHLSMGLNFMFELLSGGIVEYICKKIDSKGINYGFGGIGRLGKGLLPAEYILTEHYRLGSQMTILSRSFCKIEEVESTEELQDIFNKGIKEIRDFENEISEYKNVEFEENHKNVIQLVAQVNT